MFQDQFQPLLDCAWGQRRIFLPRRWEQPSGGRRFPVFGQSVQDGRRQDDRADGGLCFRLCKGGTCTAAKGLLVDLQLPCLHIQIFPLERQQFPQSESSGQFQKEEFVVAFILSLDQQPLHLLTVQHLHLFSVGGWQFAVVGGIAMDQVLRRRLIQDLAAARRSFCRSIFSFRSPPLFSSPHDFGGFAILTCTSSLTSI